MTDFRRPTASTRLPDCPRWATMHWVPPRVMVRLERNVKALRKLGYPARRADVVGARIFVSPPPEREELAAHLSSYRSEHHKDLRPGGKRAALMMRMPSAISRRLDTLVTGIQDIGLVAYRHEVIGTLILDYEPESEEKLVIDFNEYRRARVKDLVTPDAPLSILLDATHPAPGPRSR